VESLNAAALARNTYLLEKKRSGSMTRPGIEPGFNLPAAFPLSSSYGEKVQTPSIVGSIPRFAADYVSESSVS
jgi:hypothetical protein